MTTRVWQRKSKSSKIERARQTLTNGLCADQKPIKCWIVVDFSPHVVNKVVNKIVKIINKIVKNNKYFLDLIPVQTRDTAVTGCGMATGRHFAHRTRTRPTRFQNTAGILIPVPKPTVHWRWWQQLLQQPRWQQQQCLQQRQQQWH